MKQIRNGDMGNGEDYFAVYATVLEAPKNGPAAGTSHDEIKLVAPMVDRFRRKSIKYAQDGEGFSDAEIARRLKDIVVLYAGEYAELRARVTSMGFTRNTLKTLEMIENVLSAPDNMQDVAPEVAEPEAAAG